MKSQHKIFLPSFFLLFFFFLLSGSYASFVKYEAKRGDSKISVLSRFNLARSSLKAFDSLNKGRFDKYGGLMKGNIYDLPIAIYKYNGRSIRTTIGISDYAEAKKIQAFNEKAVALGMKEEDYRIDGELWLPLGPHKAVTPGNPPQLEKSEKLRKRIEPLFGKGQTSVKEISHQLKGRTFYLVTGHGGPDPGAIGYSSKHILAEDEYAYDVILRLGRRIAEYGGDFYIIVQDKADGIREERFLENNNKEKHYGNKTIPDGQAQRLRSRVEIINRLFDKNEFDNEFHHLIEIHVDSREDENKNVDIFFYHNSASQKGKDWAEIMKSTIEHKYQSAQPGRGYEGSVSARDELYMIRKSKPVTTFIELGNIQNPRDQQRLLEPNNRQAIANWLTDGLLKIAKNTN